MNVGGNGAIMKRVPRTGLVLYRAWSYGGDTVEIG